MVKVSIKWNKDNLEVDVATTEGLEVLKAQLFALTNVPVDRQRLLLKGKVLKSDADVASLTESTKLMLMGTADPLPEAPKEKIVFEEDLSNEQKNEMKGVIQPAGLVNLGNTCYMNSTLQCLRGLPELKSSLSEFSRNAPRNPDLSTSLTKNMGDLFTSLENSSTAVTPFLFTHSFRTAFPQFAQTNNQGAFMQQDADEALVELLNLLSANLPSKDSSNTVDKLFGGSFETSMKCLESDAEPVVTKVEPFRKLRCHIDQNINFLHDGLLKSLTETMEKRSSALSRNANFEKTSAINQLPSYLVVQFVRFFWRNDTQKKSKVLRKVTFPMILDASPYCNASLKKAIVTKREKKIRDEEIKLGLSKLGAPVSDAAPAAASAAPAADAPAPMETEESKETLPQIDHLGYYQLTGVITHQGRTADSGHYIGWVRQKDDEWVKFDDENVSPVSEEEILNLSGGGDWHTAYILFYRKLLDTEDHNPKKKKKEGSKE